MILRKVMLALSERHTDIKMNPVVAGCQVGFLGHTGFQVRARLTEKKIQSRPLFLVKWFLKTKISCLTII